MADAVRVHDLWAGYGKAEPVIQAISFELPASSFTAVIGPNGSGKSTLLRALCGLHPRARGEVRLGDVDPAKVRPKERARRVAYLPQREAEEAPFSALSLVLMGRFAFQGALPFDRASDVEMAERCLAQVEALPLRDRLLSEMSGGERQRVHLARALAQEPSVLLLDEPAASLDFRHQVATYRLLQKLHREQGRTLLVVSHDLNLPASFAEHVVVLRAGKLAAFGPPREVLRAAVLEPVFGTRLLEASAPGVDHPVLLPAP